MQSMGMGGMGVEYLEVEPFRFLEAAGLMVGQGGGKQPLCAGRWPGSHVLCYPAVRHGVLDYPAWPFQTANRSTVCICPPKPAANPGVHTSSTARKIATAPPPSWALT